VLIYAPRPLLAPGRMTVNTCVYGPYRSPQGCSEAKPPGACGRKDCESPRKRSPQECSESKPAGMLGRGAPPER